MGRRARIDATLIHFVCWLREYYCGTFGRLGSNKVEKCTCARLACTKEQHTERWEELVRESRLKRRSHIRNGVLLAHFSVVKAIKEIV